MTLAFLHQVTSLLLFSAVFADAFFVRSPSLLPNSDGVEPPWAKAWRTQLGLLEMFLFLIVFGLGTLLWMPQIKTLPPALFHSKFALGLSFLILAKLRMLKERKANYARSVLFSRLMLTILFIMALIGMGSVKGILG
jgi:hypothetical protein